VEEGKPLPEVDDEQEIGGSPRPFWSGVITFGLVSIPVNLFPANRRLAFPSACSVRKDTRYRDGTMRRLQAVSFPMNSCFAGTRSRKMNTLW
jgi:hypothetical protein